MNFLSVSVFETLESFSGWLSVGIIAAVILGFAFLFFFNKNGLKDAISLGSVILFFYALGMAIAVLLMEIFKYQDAAYLAANGYDKGTVSNLFVPLIIGIGVLLFGGISLVIAKSKKPELINKARVFSGVSSGLAVVASVLLAVL